MSYPWKKLTVAWNQRIPSGPARRPRQVGFSWDRLEDRTVMSHGGGFHPVQAVASQVAAAGATAHVASTGSTGTTGSSNSTLTTALQTLHAEIQMIELASGTTIGELTAIKSTMHTLATDGLKPSSQSALTTFENSLVTASASGTTLTGDSTLLSQFEALYTTTTTTLTTQETTDLTNAYNALAMAVTSSGITSADITAVNTDYAAVLSAEGNTSNSTYPYFSIVTGNTNTNPIGRHAGMCH